MSPDPTFFVVRCRGERLGEGDFSERESEKLIIMTCLPWHYCKYTDFTSVMKEAFPMIWMSTGHTMLENQLMVTYKALTSTLPLNL